MGDQAPWWKEAAKALFDAIDMAEILDLKLNRVIGRRNHHHEVWLSWYFIVATQRVIRLLMAVDSEGVYHL